jgi:hypothetical protein
MNINNLSDAEINDLVTKFSGRMAAITKHLDAANVPKAEKMANNEKVTSRVKWLSLRVQELELENQRLRIDI